MHHPTLCALAVALLSALPGAQGMYSKNSPVLQVDAKSYDRLIAKSNHTSIVEFYAPWCGHCKNLKPAYEKAAKNLQGLAKVAAIDCDEDANKQFCGSMGVQGFPTLKIVRPKKGGGRPMVEDFQGQRTASAIVSGVVDRINNHVVKVEDKSLDKFLSDKNTTAKALLFTDKGTTSALIRSVAIDFLDVITVGQVRNKEAKTVETFGITKFPTLVLLPGGDAPGIVYDGEIKKEAMVQFLSQAGEPNPDPAPAKAKGDNGKKAKKDKKPAKAESSSASSDEPAADTPEPKSEPEKKEKPAPPSIPIINTDEQLTKECLTDKSHTCLLVFFPTSENSEAAKQALSSLATLMSKHAQAKRNIFPFFGVPKDSEGAASLVKTLGLTAEVELVAVNARRGWWRHFEADSFSQESIEAWIDAIRMSEGVKKKLPEGIVVPASEPTPKASPEAEAELPEATESAAKEEPTPLTPDASSDEAATDATESESESTQTTDPTVEPETATEHDEL